MAQQTIQLSREQLIRQLKLAPEWEIRDSGFGSVLVSSNNGKSLEDAINDMQNDYAGYSLIIKAGTKDKAGRFSNNTKTFGFVMPQNTTQNENFMIDIVQPQAQQNQLFGFGNERQNPQGVPGNVYELFFQEKVKTLEGITATNIEKMRAENTQQIAEIKAEYRQRELDLREARISEKEQDIENREIELNILETERLEKILPSAKTALSGLSNLLFDFMTSDKKTELGKSPENKDTENVPVDDTPTDDTVDTDVSDVENATDVDNLLGKLSEEQKDILLLKLTDDIDLEDAETVIETPENVTINKTDNDNGEI